MSNLVPLTGEKFCVLIENAMREVIPKKEPHYIKALIAILEKYQIREQEEALKIGNLKYVYFHLVLSSTIRHYFLMHKGQMAPGFFTPDDIDRDFQNISVLGYGERQVLSALKRFKDEKITEVFRCELYSFLGFWSLRLAYFSIKGCPITFDKIAF